MWEGKSEVELFRGLATGVLPNLREFAPDAPESIVRLVQRAIDVDPEKRFANALEMLSAIEDASAKEGLLTRPHELALFMAQHFGDARREEQTQIRAALRAEPDSGAIENTGSRQRVIAGNLAGDFARVSDEPVELLDVQSSRTVRVRPRGVAVAAAALAALLLVGTWAVVRTPSSARSVAASLAPKTVQLEVQALPAGAEILLDGELLASDHFAGPRPTNERKVWLEVRAPGRLTERKEIALTRDMTLQIVLAPDPALAAAPAPAAAESSSSTPNSRARPASASRPSKSANRWAQCNPPYVFAKDGVKTYKPECF